MPLNLSGASQEEYRFEGPFTETGDLSDRPGIFIIVSSYGNMVYPIDIDVAQEIKSVVENHDRHPCWEKSSKNEVLFGAYYTDFKDEDDRKAVADDIRKNYRFPCG